MGALIGELSYTGECGLFVVVDWRHRSKEDCHHHERIRWNDAHGPVQPEHTCQAETEQTSLGTESLPYSNRHLSAWKSQAFTRDEVQSNTPDITRPAFLVVHVDKMIWRWSVAVIFKLQPRAVRAAQNSLSFPERRVI